MIKVSDYIVKFLISKNIDTIFMVSGGTAAHIMESVKNSGIRYICNYHEQACAMAAEAYARISGKPACVLVTNGPGSTNTITGVLGAYQDSIPMIIISGQSPVGQSLSSITTEPIRQLGVQECDIISIVKSITKYAKQIRNVDEVIPTLNDAWNHATEGRMGPVWIDVPIDIQNLMLLDDTAVFQPINVIQPDITNNVMEAIAMLREAKKPLIVLGNGVHLAKAESSFLELKNRSGIPVVATWSAKDIMNHGDPQYVGNFGLFGERAANFAIQRADCLLILGSRLSIPNIGYNSKLFSPNSKKIMVDCDMGEMKKHTLNIDLPIKSDVKIFIDEFVRLLNLKLCDNDWGTTVCEWKQLYSKSLPEYQSRHDSINSFQFIETLSPHIPQNSIIVTDMGTAFTCTMQYLPPTGYFRLFTSSACCSMGYGLPGAIGAYFATNGERPVILIAGDGGFQMNIQELQTLVHYNIPIKIFILNNNGYRAISIMQENLFGGNYIGANPDSGVSSPKFVNIAKAYGIQAVRADNIGDLQKIIDGFLKSKFSGLCEINMQSDQILIPRVQSKKDAAGKIISGSLDVMFPYLEDV